MMPRAYRRALLTQVLLLSPFATIGCGDGYEAHRGPLRIRALVPIADTLRWAVEGLAEGDRLLRPTAELKISGFSADGDEPFAQVRRVLGLTDGSAVVFDEGTGRIGVFDPRGRRRHTVGGAGAGPGEYGVVYGVTALPGDSLAVWDGSHARINLYDASGRFIRALAAPPLGLSTSDGLQSDVAGNLFLSALLKFDPQAPEQSIVGLVRWDSLGLLDSIPFPRWNALAPTLVARMANGATVSGGSVPYLPRDHTRLLANGTLVTGPGAPYQFVLTEPRGGRPTRIERAHAAVAVSQAEADSLRRQIEAMMRRVEPAWRWTIQDIPAVKPAYRALEVDREGRIWIQVSTPTLDVPRREAPVYDVYDPSGAPIARIELPVGARFASATRDYLWTVRLDSLDEVVVERARLRLPVPLAFPPESR